MKTHPRMIALHVEGAATAARVTAADAPSNPQRRRLLSWFAAAALVQAGCKGPAREQILPYVDSPEGMVAGEPMFFATAFVRNGYAHGVLVESNMGRPTKVEGNPLHPASVGATDAFAQAAILELWDPDRAQTPTRGNNVATWEAFVSALEARRPQFERDGGAGLAILTGTVTSPTLQAQLQALRLRLPQLRWYAYDPLDPHNAARGASLAFGRPVDTIYHFGRAQVVLTLDADFLSEGPASVRHARDFAQLRRADNAGFPSRLYALETTPGLAGAMADERLALSPAQIETVLTQVAVHLGIGGSARREAPHAKWARLVAQRLKAAGANAVVVPGATLAPESHALVHAINARLGAVGRTVDYIEPVAAGASRPETIDALATEMHAGRIDTLLILGGNPVYDAPADLGFAEALQHVPMSLHWSLFPDETSLRCSWQLPATHDFESWSDARAFDGTATILQPVIQPLYAGRSSHEVLALVDRPQHLQGAPADGRAIVRAHWAEAFGGAGEFETRWRESLRAGVVDGSASARLAPRAAEPAAVARTPAAAGESAPGGARQLTVVFTRDPAVDDGRFTNNAWLQELPRPLTKLVWDNAAQMSAATAAAIGVANGDRIVVRTEAGSVVAPAWIQPGHADEAITLPLGYGRSAAGRVGNGIGFDAYRVRSTNARATAVASVERASGRHDLVTSQVHDLTHDRDLVRHATVDEFRRNPAFARDTEKERVPETSLYPEYSYPVYAWGMAIDLNACIGCRACTIACQVENNIPVVGKSEVELGREMHWIRVDRYYESELELPRSQPRSLRTWFQPVPCMHCEKAPCEEVCPVGATMHDSEGLNVQVYNRCIGTRFCSNNCPYKVRRFNFLHYAPEDSPHWAALQNPEVTVRYRGVMEKCTYCLQRITRARIEAEKEGRRIADGEVVTACQAVCPTRAITFGDLNDPASAVNAVKRSPLDYTLLAELNTRPRTTYLARLLNPDPDLTSD